MSEEEYIALRPTRQAWKCPNCGVELYTVECIKTHKERCKNKQK